MIFQCSDLERALRTPELMPEMRAHAAHCEACGRQLYLWSEISRVAAELHEEWESPLLWQRIRAELSAQAPPRKPVAAWRWAAAVAAAAILAAALSQPWRTSQKRMTPRELLTD